jgi:hypothetical protein
VACALAWRLVVRRGSVDLTSSEPCVVAVGSVAAQLWAAAAVAAGAAETSGVASPQPASPL